MSAHDRLATALEAIVGSLWVRRDAAAAAYAIDACLPAFVVFPADEDEVAAVLRLADEHQATVFPRGSGSHMTLGNAPTRVDIVLSVQRLQRLLAYEPGDMTTTVQAGMCLVDLQRTLAPHGQYLALDPSAAATTTIGGIVAANLSGPRRLLYGTARDLLLGSAVIGINGKRTKAGGRVVKNVTGYDLNKLYIGSLGTLAVIVELTWKLHPLPAGEHTLGIGVTQAADLPPILRLLLELPLRLNSLTLLNDAAMADLARDAEVALPQTPYCFLARVEGTEQVLQSQEQRLIQALQHLSAMGAITTQTWQAEAPARLWHGVEELPLLWQAAVPHSVISKVSLRLADVPVFFREMAAAAAATPWPIFAHAGSGIVYICQSLDEASPTDVQDLMQPLQVLDDCVARLHGRRVIEHAPLTLKRQCDVWGTPGDDFALMRAIKASFDPHCRLNPGRFLGGL
jgi:glycolate oxidase FAD binding subunit